MTSNVLPTPDELYCQICKALIPEGRRTRQTSVCSEKCKNRLDTIRMNQRRNKKCSYCLHPSSPEEREEWRQWRASKGEIRETKFTRDRTLQPKNLMVEGIRSAVRMLQKRRDALAGHLGDENVVESNLEQFAGHSPEDSEQLAKDRKELREVTNLITRLEELAKPRSG